MSARIRGLASPAFSTRGRNPYNWLLYTHLQALDVEVEEYSRRRLLAGGYDVWHLHWPEAPLNEPSAVRALAGVLELLFMLRVARRRGTKVLWTIHNLSAHEERHPRLARWFARAFVRQVDGYISLTKAGQTLALHKYPQLGRVPGFVMPHGHYRTVYPDHLDRAAARTRLGLGPRAVVLAFVGQLRRYKGVEALCRAFRTLRNDEIHLLIAGAATDDMAAAIRAAAGDDPRITLHPAFIQDADLHVYLRAADLVVLPFVDVLNSGSALLALSFDVPILVPSTATLRELRDAVGSEWVFTYDGCITTNALSGAIDALQSTRRVGRPPLDSMAWPTIARQTLNAMRAIARPAERAQLSLSGSPSSP
jgi:glycosyltransferase involved in cell wall biosynthesis